MAQRVEDYELLTVDRVPSPLCTLLLTLCFCSMCLVNPEVLDLWLPGYTTQKRFHVDMSVIKLAFP